VLSRRHYLSALACGVLSGCAGSKRRRIAVIPKATSHEFWLSVQDGALAAGQELKVDVLWNGPPAETDYSRQMQIVDSMVSQRVDGIALAASESTALVAPVERAIAAGIPVTIFDSGLNTDKFLSYVATDNVEVGRIGARALVSFFGSKGKVALLMHAPGSASTMDREKGFREVITREYPDVRIVAEQFGMSDRAKSRGAAENILTAHPDLKGIFASAEPASVGAALAIAARQASDRTSLVGVDSSEKMIDDLRSGAMDAMVVQDAHRLGFEAVRTLVDKLDGKTPPKRIDLSGRLIKKSDLENPEVKRLLKLK
jgi:ribose transport system substrate-binding protein